MGSSLGAGRGPRRFSFLVSLILVSLLGACNEVPPPPDIPGVGPAPVASHSDGVDIYVDDSAAMRGFVDSPNSRYKRIATTLVERIVAARRPYDVARFSDFVDGSQGRPVEPVDLLSPYFYGRRRTSIPALLDKLGRDRANGRTVVIVTDLGRSEGAGRQYALIAAFGRASKAWPHVFLLGFESSFRGRYWTRVGTAQETDVPLDFDGSDRAHRRPFYFLVLSASREAVSKFREDVLDSLTPFEEFHASESCLLIDDFEFVGGDGSVGLYDQRPRQPFVSLGATVAKGAFVKRGTSERGVAVLRMRIRAERRLPMRSLEDMRHEVTRRQSQGDDWTLVDVRVRVAKDTGAAAGEPDSARLSFILSYEFPDVEGRRRSWDTYRVRSRAGRAAAGAPPWVARWDGREDGRPAPGHLTLNLMATVEAIMRAVTDEVVLKEQYIQLWNS